MLALSVLALVIGITSGAIFYSTQTSLGLHKDIIEILHLLGAKDTYIAQQYAAKTAVLGFWGGLIGVVFAVPTILSSPIWRSRSKAASSTKRGCPGAPGR